ncbi:MAG: DUF58 domain-containing protein [Phycisphaeraceae bacterium]|nr:MAG: DUF58 domain-containing protein [Phycisphaeraceae bacterium]
MPSGPRRSESGPTVDASLYLHPQTLARLTSFELRAKMIIEGLSSGLHRSPFQGYSVEFAQHRPYVPGDDLRHLDWKVYGRSDKLQLKQYQQETNLDLLVLVDSSGSMNYGSRLFAEASGSGREVSLDGRTNWTKFDHATAMAAALAYITLRQGDRVGLVVFADEVRHAIRRSGGKSAWRPIVSALATHPDQTPGSEPRPTDLRRAVDQILGGVANRCLMVIVSDLFQDVAHVREALARVRHAGHDLIVFQVLDRAELDFPFTDTAPFMGLEGEPTLRVDPRALRDGYLKALADHLAAVQRLVRGFGFDHQVVDTHDWLGPALAAFVARRNAQIKRSKYG